VSEADFVKVETSDSVALVTVNRPDKLNALNAATIRALAQTFRALHADEAVRGIILTGEGPKSFVAGADIGELAQMGPITGVRVSRERPAVEDQQPIAVVEEQHPSRHSSLRQTPSHEVRQEVTGPVQRNGG
jgi:enoyl-CoA hydratase/carnithine racemase